jgi:hypothetical protein
VRIRESDCASRRGDRRGVLTHAAEREPTVASAALTPLRG